MLISGLKVLFIFAKGVLIPKGIRHYLVSNAHLFAATQLVHQPVHSPSFCRLLYRYYLCAPPDFTVVLSVHYGRAYSVARPVGFYCLLAVWHLSCVST